MAIFGRKRVKNVKKEFVPPVDVQEISEMSFNKRSNQSNHVPTLRSMPERPIQQEEMFVERPVAPVFIKLNKYRQVLSTINHLKMNLNIIVNQLSVLNELDKLRDENINMMKNALDKVNDNIAKLDSNFMRPSGHTEHVSDMKMNDVENLEGTIDDLRTQIDVLKSEVETVA